MVKDTYKAANEANEKARKAGSKAFRYNHGKPHNYKKDGDWWLQPEFVGVAEGGKGSEKRTAYIKKKAEDLEADTMKRSTENRKKLVQKYAEEDRQLALSRRKMRRSR